MLVMPWLLTRRRLLLAASVLPFTLRLMPKVRAMVAPPQLLTDPVLQLPTPTSVRVVWFTEFVGKRHTVHYGKDLEQVAIAMTRQLSRTAEDADSLIPQPPQGVIARPVWRHEATVTGLQPGQRLPYRVTSEREDQATVHSAIYHLAAAPTRGQPLKILLTSDHQLKPMVAANLQKVVETVGPVDLVLFAGDLVNTPDRASEWFDEINGGAFFPALQGRAHYTLEKNNQKTLYRGAAIIQNAPMYTAIGNHEVMGRRAPGLSLNQQYNRAVPRQVAISHYYKEKGIPYNDQNASMIQQQNPIDPQWLKDHSFNTDTYEELFTLPQSPMGGQRYYSVSFGDMRLIVLYVTNVWRSPSLDPQVQGKYREREDDVQARNLLEWGHGQHIFEPIHKGSPQYQWLEQELQRPEWRQARYKVVMFHHPPHSLGENSVPPYTDPLAIYETDEAGNTSLRYEYPKQNDYIIRDLLPLLEKAGTNLVFYGHSHLWNRFVSPSGTHFLETSNVGNSYGAYINGKRRQVPQDTRYDQRNYAPEGNPYGLEAVIPTIAPLLDEAGRPLAYVASNDITVFSILDTGTGIVSSYRFDTRQPDQGVVKFDQFSL